MNINDVSDKIEIPEKIWKDIFDKQWALAIKYRDIEGMGDLLDTLDKNIDTGKGQRWIKDFAWRITEELAEAWEAVYALDKGVELSEKESYKEHIKEEIIDGLHFLVELTQIAGYTYEFVEKCEAEMNGKALYKMETPWPVVYELGLLCNTLKNKPWKQTQMLTDRNKFETILRNVWQNYIQLLYMEVGNAPDIYLYYFKKQEVNKFRQRSKY